MLIQTRFQRRTIQKLIRCENVAVVTVFCCKALAFSSDVSAVVDISAGKPDAGVIGNREQTYVISPPAVEHLLCRARRART